MANRVRILDVSPADVSELDARVRAKSAPARVVERARIVLLASHGIPGAGLAGLEDEPRSGRPRRLPPRLEERIIAATLAGPPKSMGVTHWSSRLLARRLKVSHVTITRVWRAYGLKPHRTQTFKFCTDPDLEWKIEDVVGLYLNPPEGAVVLCVDEKSQIQALERTQPILPLRPGLPERATHDYVRHGTATLFAALEVATGRVTDRTFDRHRHEEFLAFLKLVAKTYRERELHIVLDNYGTHTHPAVMAWLAENPRIHLHFTPKGASWLNLVEAFFSIITRQAIRRGSFTSVRDLMRAIRRFIDAWNERCAPFVWTSDATSILAQIKRQDGSLTRH